MFYHGNPQVCVLHSTQIRNNYAYSEYEPTFNRNRTAAVAKERINIQSCDHLKMCLYIVTG